MPPTTLREEVDHAPESADLVTLTLTPSEARALWRAVDCSIGPLMDEWDRFAVLGRDPATLAAGARGLEKLGDALAQHSVRYNAARANAAPVVLAECEDCGIHQPCHLYRVGPVAPDGGETSMAVCPDCRQKHESEVVTP